VTYGRTRTSGGVLVFSLIAGLVLGALAQSQEFVQRAGVAALYELRAAELARERTRDEQVRVFADQVIETHARANTELSSLASDHDWRVPAELDRVHQKLLSKLSALEGREFDREYARQQLRALRQAVSLFQQQARTGTNGDLKQWADENVSALEEHRARAADLALGEPSQPSLPPVPGVITTAERSVQG